MWCKSYELRRLAYLIITCLENYRVSGEGERVGGYLWEIAHYLKLRIDNSRQGMIRGILLSSAAILSTVSYYTSN